VGTIISLTILWTATFTGGLPQQQDRWIRANIALCKMEEKKTEYKIEQGRIVIGFLCIDAGNKKVT